MGTPKGYDFIYSSQDNIDNCTSWINLCLNITPNDRRGSVLPTFMITDLVTGNEEGRQQENLPQILLISYLWPSLMADPSVNDT
jgi:hypothetical protein